MSSQQTHEQDNTSISIDIGGVLTGIWSRKTWIILTTLIAAAGSIVFVAMATPEYESEARVLVKNLETDFSRTNSQRSTITAIDQQEVKSQVEVISSRDLGKKVITRLNLTERREFSPARRGVGPVSQFLMALGFITDPRKQTAMQQALGVYYKKMNAYQIPDSKVIAITMKSDDPKLAADVANTLAREFVSDTRNVQSQTTGRARNWLADQITLLRKKVIESEIAAEKFRASAGLLKGRDQNATLSAQELSELNTQIILAEAQRSEIQARAKSIRDLLARTGSVAASAEVLNSSLIQRLRERQVTLRGNMAELSTTYLPNHPRIIAVRREIEGLNRQVRSEALKIVTGLGQQAKVSTARVASLRASLNGLKSQASGSNLDQVKLRALEREATANRTLLETFLTKFSDASSRQGAVAQPGLARLISSADVSLKPSFPKPGPTVVLATIGGLILSTGIAFMAAVMGAVSGTGAGTSTTNRQQSAFLQSAQQITGQPASGVAAEPAPIPIAVTTASLSQLPVSTNLEMAAANALGVVQNSATEFSIGLAPVTSWVNSSRQTLGAKRLAVVGLPGAEMDSAAACLGLARSLAAQNIRTILVDAAMPDSQLAAMTGTANLPGLADLLTGYASFMDAIIKDQHSNARIMRVGQSHAAAWPLLSGERMETVLGALDNDENHDMVIVHGGVLSPQAGNTNGAVGKCQSGLLVVSGNQVALTGNAMQMLSASGLRATQYIRVADGGGLQQMADNVTPMNAAFATFATVETQGQVPGQATVAYNAPLFPKVAV